MTARAREVSIGLSVHNYHTLFPPNHHEAFLLAIGAPLNLGGSHLSDS
ncbi:hypothetical protein [Rubritalea tangerina]